MVRCPDAKKQRYDRVNEKRPGFGSLFYAVEMLDPERAKTIVLDAAPVSARDSLHIAIMERHGVSRILSFDSGFDHFPDLQRLH